MDAQLLSASASVIISLVVIIFLLVCFSFLARYIKNRFQVKKGDDSIQILVKAKYSIGIQQHLVVVEINGEYFFLSACKGGVRLISQLNKHD